ncbi:MAG: chemotaxis-specific protein-glutamate methyltransferase CheB [Pseudomonadales bacterium]
MKQIHVHSGELAFSDGEVVQFHTVVGVCVAVCLWDKVGKRGGLCHYRLPDIAARGDSAISMNDFGTEAIVALLKKFKRHGSVLENLQARVLGGGDIPLGSTELTQSIGQRNTDVALELLASFGIPVLGQAVGGALGRQIRFNSGTGEVNFRVVDGQDFEDQAPEYPVADAHAPLVLAVRDPNKINVLIIDHSSKMRKRLKRTIEENDECVVVAQVSGPGDAMVAIEKLKPDVITLDINGKNVDWLAFIGFYMQQHSIPTIIVSSFMQETPEIVFKAMKIGVFDYLERSSLDELHDMLKAAHQFRAQLGFTPASTVVEMDKHVLEDSVCHSSLIVLGSSTGGVEALEVVIKQLPKATPPICIVQHIPKNFSLSLANRLNDLCAIEVSEATDGMDVEDNHVYIAPGGRHMKLIELASNQLIIRLSDEPRLHNVKPAVDYLFKSVEHLRARKVVGVLLTGMGGDGAQGLLKLKELGAFTLAQDEVSSVVYGMAKVAKEMGAVCRSVPIIGITSAMLEAAADSSNRMSLAINRPPQDALEVNQNVVM